MATATIQYCSMSTKYNTSTKYPLFFFTAGKRSIWMFSTIPAGILNSNEILLQVVYLSLTCAEWHHLQFALLLWGLWSKSSIQSGSCLIGMHCTVLCIAQVTIELETLQLFYTVSSCLLFLPGSYCWPKLCRQVTWNLIKHQLVCIKLSCAMRILYENTSILYQSFERVVFYASISQR